MEYIKISEIRLADYNPRSITEEKFAQLQESIRQNGFVLPVIVNKANNVLIAGHQRVNAARVLNINEVPFFYVENITESDERFFNQFHNGVDFDSGAKAACNVVLSVGYSIACASDFTTEKIFPLYVDTIARLILKYGNVFCAVVENSKSVIMGQNYIKAAQLLKLPVNVFNLDRANKNLLLARYGEYSYDRLHRTTWCQGLAQMPKTAEQREDKRAQHSALYESLVLPYLKSRIGLKVLDFGCGKGSYIKYLAEKNLCAVAVGVEFYNNQGKTINKRLGDYQITKLRETLKRHGLFDVVICDSVINSVDSLEAERAVIDTCSSFLNVGGLFFISGRCREFEDLKSKYRKFAGNASRESIYMMDRDGLSAIFRSGNWYYQKFHYKSEIIDVLKNREFSQIEYSCRNSSAYQIKAIKHKNLSMSDMKAAIDFEFNLPLPQGKSYGRSTEIWEKLNTIYSKAKENGD